MAAGADGGGGGAAKTAMQRLIDEPKGKTDHAPDEAFLLHVFWETPSASAASELLAGLRRCAKATHRDTPCVPSYFFRVSSNDADLCPPPPKTVAECPQLRDGIRKLRVGTPRPAVVADFVRRGIDPAYLDLDLDADLPAELQTRPVKVEFTEVYLDERAFMEHAGSRDYLAGYGVVVDPKLQNKLPTTIRVGTPAASLVEKLLEPMLREKVEPLVKGSSVWRRPQQQSSDSEALLPVFLSIDVPFVDAEDAAAGDDAAAAVEAVSAALPSDFGEHCTTFVAFLHPLRPSTVRIMCVVPSLQPQSALAGLAALRPVRGEAHTLTAAAGSDSEAATEKVRAALVAAGLPMVKVNAAEAVGYVLHERAADVHVT